MERVRLTPPDWNTPEAMHWIRLLLLDNIEQESRCIGTHTDDNGVEHQVWQHTFTPTYYDEEENDHAP